MSNPDSILHGRGTGLNPANRFEQIESERVDDYDASEERPPVTQFFKDETSTILNHNDSPDVGFSTGINSYRGCEHGCAYCFARPTHEYLGFSAGIDFETRILVKQKSPDLLRKELSSPKWKPQVVAMSGVTDCYQPIERKLGITRKCLEVFLEFRNPVVIITKNYLVTRDIDLLKELSRFKAVAVHVSVTTLDAALTSKLEPRASLPQFRLKAIRELSQAGVQVGVLAAPMIPGLTDHELPRIIAAAAEAGACYAGYVPLRLPYAVKNIFAQWLEDHYPEKKERVLNRIRAIRGGKLNDPDFVTRMRGEGVFADQLSQMFEVASRKAGLDGKESKLKVQHFRRPDGPQMTLF